MNLCKMLDSTRITERSIQIHTQSSPIFNLVKSWPNNWECSLVNLEITTLKDVTEHVIEMAFEWQAIRKATCLCVQRQIVTKLGTHKHTLKRFPTLIGDYILSNLIQIRVPVSHREEHWEKHSAAIWEVFYDSKRPADIFLEGL